MSLGLLPSYSEELRQSEGTGAEKALQKGWHTPPGPALLALSTHHLLFLALVGLRAGTGVVDNRGRVTVP